MSTARRRYGEQDVCALCSQDIQWHGRAGGWRDRGGNRQCVSYRDRDGEIVKPPASAKHKPEVR